MATADDVFSYLNCTAKKEAAMDRTGEVSHQQQAINQPTAGAGCASRESIASVMRREARQLRAHAEYLETIASASEQLNPKVENAMYEFYMHTKRQNYIR